VECDRPVVGLAQMVASGSIDERSGAIGASIRVEGSRSSIAVPAATSANVVHIPIGVDSTDRPCSRRATVAPPSGRLRHRPGWVNRSKTGDGGGQTGDDLVAHGCVSGEKHRYLLLPTQPRSLRRVRAGTGDRDRAALGRGGWRDDRREGGRGPRPRPSLVPAHPEAARRSSDRLLAGPTRWAISARARSVSTARGAMASDSSDEVHVSHAGSGQHHSR
jgi:hypothetical protein